MKSKIHSLQTIKINKNIKHQELIRRRYQNKILEKNEDILNLKLKMEEAFSSKHDVEIIFHFNQFLKYFLYNFIYHLFFGPLTLLVIIPIEGYYATYNMGFIGLSTGHFFSIISYLCGPPIFFLAFYYKYYINPTTNFDISEIIYTILLLSIRTIVIGIRYGYTAKNVMEEREKSILHDGLMNREYLINGWRNIDINSIDMEIEESMERLSIESHLFYYNVITNLNDDWTHRLNNFAFLNNEELQKENDLKFVMNIQVDNNILKSLKEIEIFDFRYERKIKSSYSKSKFDYNSDEIGSFNKILPEYAQFADSKLNNLNFSAIILLKEFLFFTTNNSRFNFMNLFNVVMMIVHCLIPSFYRNFKNQPFFGNNSIETIIITSNMFLGFFVYYTSLVFIEVGINDYQRRAQLIDSLDSLLDVDKLTISDYFLRYVPCINIFCKKNLKTWLFMRLLIMDLGKRFMCRIEIYSSIFLGYYSALILILLLGISKIIHIPPWIYPNLYLMGSFQIINVLFVLMCLIYQGSSINDKLTNHKYKLGSLFYDLSLLRNNLSFIDNNIKFPLNSVFRAAKYFFKGDDHSGNMDTQKFSQKLNETLEIINIINERVVLENRFRPLKILGLKLSFRLFGSILFGLSSISVSVGPYIYNLYFK